jgi:ATP-dependent Clp endopeptidase proteolytic subunit ClpP
MEKSMKTLRERSDMLLRLGVPRRLADRICDAPPRQQAGRFTFRAADDAGAAEILIYDYIGYDWWSDTGITALSFHEQLQAMGGAQQLTVRINSPGGEVWDGMSIYNQLSQFAAHTTVVIEGIAASVASLIAMAGDTVKAMEVSQLMIHDAWTIAVGNEQDFRALADTLAKVDQQIADTYAIRSGTKTAKQFREIMNQDTYLTAQDALEWGLVDEVIPTRKTGEKTQQANQKASRLVQNQISLLRSSLAIS